MGNGKKRKRGGGGFEIVPAGFRGRGDGRGGGRGGGGRASHNTLRKAFSSAMSKADEIWFRKCGHGERLFASYYRGQVNVIPLVEWGTFQSTIDRKLPVTFRLRAGSDGEQGRAAAVLEDRLRELGTVQPVPWAPASARIWQAVAKLDKRAVAKASAEGGEALGAALSDGVTLGLLNRQEVVSMMPVMALRVAAGSHVLDMCASPGSKTMQLLEAVAADRRGGRGIVMANDAHPKRVAALIGAIERHNRCSAERRQLVVTCHRGEAFPAPSRPFRKPPLPASPTAESAEQAGAASEGADGAGEAAAAVGFDRVLADVPCSGDGTVRKDPTVLPRWTPAVGTQLHAAQLAIAWRGLELLRVGGLMAYSTCSLNPMEDEVCWRRALRPACVWRCAAHATRMPCVAPPRACAARPIAPSLYARRAGPRVSVSV